MTIKVSLRSEGPGVVLFLLLATFITAVVTQKDDVVPDPDGRISDTIFNRTKRQWWGQGMRQNIRYEGSDTAYDGEPWHITCSGLSRGDEAEWTRDWNSLHREFRTGRLRMQRTSTSSTLYSTAGRSRDVGRYRCTSNSGYYDSHYLGYSSEGGSGSGDSDAVSTSEDPYHLFDEDTSGSGDSDAVSTSEDPYHLFDEDTSGSGDSDAVSTSEDPYHLFDEDTSGSGDSDAVSTSEDPYHLYDEDTSGSGDSGAEWTTEAPSYSLFGEDRVSLEVTTAESTRADNSICKPDANGTPAWQSALESIIVKLNGIEELSSGIHALSSNMTELSAQITHLIESNNALNESFTSLDTVIRASQRQNTELVETSRGYDRRLKVLELRSRKPRRY